MKFLAFAELTQMCVLATFLCGGFQNGNPCLGAQSPDVALDASGGIEQRVIRAFEEMHDGWSVDEVLLDDVRRGAFVRACGRDLTVQQADQFCAALLHVRKLGGKLPSARRRDGRDSLVDHFTAVGEISARRLQDALDVPTDAILVDSGARNQFDQFAQQCAAGVDPYLIRKAALRLRKTRQLQPELLSRVTDWKRTISAAPVAERRLQIADLTTRPGIYLFRDDTGYLYIGQAANLKARLQQHLLDSDRVALANYLASGRENQIQIELHVFEAGSPGEDLRTRRAYESELIRTRKPKLNLAP
jgi:hypothetical protein